MVGAAPSTGQALDVILQTKTFDEIIAADGGYEHLIKKGIEASIVFGDFDSLGYVPDHPCVEKFDTHKDYTDLDLALMYACKKGFDEIFVCDSFTGRLDHSLGNLQLLIKYAARGVKVWGFTEDEVIAPLIAPGKLSALSFEEGAWGTLSVLSHSNIAYGVSEKGLEYGVQGADCNNDALWGISNELIGKPACVSLEKGSLWVFFPLKELRRARYL